MSTVEVSKIRSIPLLQVAIGEQEPFFLDAETAAELYDHLTEVLDISKDDSDISDLAETYRQGFEAGEAAATFQRPTVWFQYNGTERNVIPITIKMGTDDVLLVGIELEKDGFKSPGNEPLVKSYRTGVITAVREGHPTTWKVAQA